MCIYRQSSTTLFRRHGNRVCECFVHVKTKKFPITVHDKSDDDFYPHPPPNYTSSLLTIPVHAFIQFLCSVSSFDFKQKNCIKKG